MSVTIVIRKLLIAKDMHVKSPKMFLGKKIRKSLGPTFHNPQVELRQLISYLIDRKIICNYFKWQLII